MSKFKIHLTRLVVAPFVLFFLASFLSFADDSKSSQSIAGIWHGIAKYKNETTRMVIDLQQVNNALSASVSLLDIGVSGWPARNVHLENNYLSMELPSDSGPQNIKLEWSGAKMVGTWQENQYIDNAELHFFRETNSSPNNEKRTLVKGLQGNLGVSIMLPAGEGPFPGVVFLHGSGPQPRDASRFAAKMFAQRGIASLFYDKRGVGESEGNYTTATFHDLASDATVVADYFSQLPKIDGVGFWGHSQGGWIGPIAAKSWHASRYVITSAGPAVSPAREAHWGFLYPLIKRAYTKDVLGSARHLIDVWHDGVRSNNWKKFDKYRAIYSNEVWFEHAGLQSLSNQPNGEFVNYYKRFMDYDPLATLNQLQVPMLAIFSPDDESIDSLESIEILTDLASSGKNIRILNYPGYSHAMRKISHLGAKVRFPNHPKDYFAIQAAFIKAATKKQ